MSTRAGRVGAALAALASVGLVGGLVLSWIPLHPLTLLEHFRAQYIVLGAIAVAAAWALRVRGYFDAALIATLAHALPVLADLGRSARPLPADGVRVRVLLANVLTSNADKARLGRLIADERPDIVGLVEVDQAWLDALAPALPVAAYPGRLEHPSDDNFGVALYARGTVTGTFEDLGTPLPTIVADVALASTRVSAVVTHLFPPVRRSWVELQRAQADGLTARVPALAHPAIVMGDFNATPWSRTFRELAAGTRLCDTRAGFGLQASWPTSFSPARIPIDHVLADCAIGVRDRRIGPDIGSDHFPVIVDLVVPAAR